MKLYAIKYDCKLTVLEKNVMWRILLNMTGAEVISLTNISKYDQMIKHHILFVLIPSCSGQNFFNTLSYFNVYSYYALKILKWIYSCYSEHQLV